MTAPRIGLLTAAASRANGGVWEAVVAQAAMLRAHGFAPHVFAPDDRWGAADAARLEGVPVTRVAPVGPRVLGVVPGLVRAMVAADLDLLHLHGIWTGASGAGATWARRTGRAYLVSPHGMLDPWITRRGRWKKAIARASWERPGWARAAFHALSEAEAADIMRETGRGAVVVPNAVPIAPRGTPAAPPYLLYLGRIHSKKNLPALLDAWDSAAVRAASPAARLVIAGWGDPGHVAALEARVAASLRASFAGPVFGAEKAALIACARFVVLPSLSEGLPVAVLEAWAAGVPTLHSAACHLAEGYAAGAAIDTGTVPDTIAAALVAALSLDEARRGAMAAAAHGLAAARFAPAVVGARWAGVYADLIARRRS